MRQRIGTGRPCDWPVASDKGRCHIELIRDSAVDTLSKHKRRNGLFLTLVIFQEQRIQMTCYCRSDEWQRLLLLAQKRANHLASKAHGSYHKEKLTLR